MASGDTLRPRAAHPDDGFPRALDLGLRTGFGDDWLSLGALKIYTDGGMMARTAALTSPYEGTAGDTGRFQDEPERIAALIVDLSPISPWTPWSGRSGCASARTPVTASSTPGWSAPTNCPGSPRSASARWCSPTSCAASATTTRR